MYIANTYLIAKICTMVAVLLVLVRLIQNTVSHTSYFTHSDDLTPRPSSFGRDHRFLRLFRNFSSCLTRLVVYCDFI
jgi:hypothetical protein